MDVLQISPDFLTAAIQAIERWNTVKDWREISHLQSAGVAVEWDLGRSRKGYEPLTRLVADRVRAQLPDLVADALNEVESEARAVVLALYRRLQELAQ